MLKYAVFFLHCCCFKISLSSTFSVSCAGSLDSWMGTLKLICKVLWKSFVLFCFFLTCNTFLYLSWLLTSFFPLQVIASQGWPWPGDHCLWRITAFLESNLHSTLKGAFLNWTAHITSRGGQDAKPATHWKDWRFRKGESARSASRSMGKEGRHGQAPGKGLHPTVGHSAVPTPGPPAPSCCGHRAASFSETLLKDTGPDVGNAPWLCKGPLKPEAHLPPSRLHTMWFK